MKYLIIILASLLAVSTSLADSVTLDGQNDMDDGYTDGNSQTTPRGTETWMYLMCGLSTCTYYGFLKFDLSGISGNIDSVSLKLHRHKPNASDQMYFYRATRDWTEDQFTWDDAKTSPDTVEWTSGGGDYNSTKIDSLSIVGGASFNQDVYCQRSDGGGLNELVQDWVDGTYNNYGIVIKSDLLGFGDTVYIYSSENFNESLYPRPKLYIEYTPSQSESEIPFRRKRLIETQGVN
ncbi:MAG: DNRLRE domain-containing protein [candidate division Zixibacteria bacterium]|nr:DNRLRE domain-containing protein [candidate division Zixibacteria bacterium]